MPGASAGGIRAGRAYVEVSADDNALRRDLRRAEARMKAFAGNVQQIGARMAGLGAAIASVGGAALAPLGAAVKASADFSEATAKSQVIFGESSKAIIAQSEAMAKQFGASKQEYVDAATSFGAVFKGLGKSQAEAADLGNQLAQLGMDMASFGNTSNADAFTALQAALRGEFDPLERFTVFLSAAKVENRALAMGLASTASELTDQQKKMATLAEIMGQTADAQGDLARTSGSLSNQLKGVAGRLQNMAVDVGSALAPAVGELLKYVNQLLQPLGEWIKNNPELIKTIGMVAAGVAVAGGAIAALGVAIVGAGAVIGGIGTILGAMGTVIGALLSPIGLVAAALVGLGGYFLYASGAGGEALGWLKDKFGELKDDALEAWKGISDALAAGDLKLAGQIVWAALKMEWMKGTNFLMGQWDEFSAYTQEVFARASGNIAVFFADAWAGIRTTWSDAMLDLQGSWGSLVARMIKTFAPVLDVIASLAGIDIQETIDNALAAVGVGEGGAVAGESLDQKKEAARAEIEADRQVMRGAIADQTEAKVGSIQEGKAQKVRARNADLAKLEGEYQGLLAQAAAAREAAPFKGEKKADGSPLTFGDLGGTIDTMERKTEVKGTFSAAVLRGLGADSTADKQLDEAKKGNSFLKKIEKNTDNLGLVT